MPIYSGQRGTVTALLFNSSWEPAALATFEVTMWSLQDAAIPADVSNVSAKGMRSATMGYNVSWTMSLPADETLEPDYVGLYAGRPVTMWFKAGDTDNYHLLQNTMVTMTSPVNNAVGDAVRYTVTGQGGKVTYYTTDTPNFYPPATVDPYPLMAPASPGVDPPGTFGSLSYPSGL